MTINRSIFASAAAAIVAIAGLAMTPAAEARDVYWSVGVGAPGVSVGVSNGYPVYTAPAPVYVQPSPVFVQSSPYYYRPAPVYVQPAPVYMQPAPVYMQAPPAYWGPGYRQGGYHRHHGHDHGRGHGGWDR